MPHQKDTTEEVRASKGGEEETDLGVRGRETDSGGGPVSQLLCCPDGCLRRAETFSHR